MNFLEDFYVLIAAFIAALFGQGGGVLYTPLQVWNGVDLHTAAPMMVFLFGIPVPIAIGSSAFMVGLTATAGLLGYISVGHFNWAAALQLAIPVIIGGQIGSRLSIHLDAQYLEQWLAFLF
jgi:uncharacterized membrane protein YfcA